MTRIPLLLATLAAISSMYVYHSLDVPSRQIALPADPHTTSVFAHFDLDASVARLARALRVKTVSRESGVVSHPEGFLALHSLFEKDYPLVHASLSREVVNGYSLLYRWEGRDPSKAPVLLASHMDVVPCPDEQMAAWDYEPFAGLVIDDEKTGGWVYGRGALDDKVGVLGILEAVELLLADGFEPEQTVYLAFGHDEEVGGGDGAVKIIETLREKHGVERLQFVLDEGGMVGDGILPIADKPVAVVAVAEKGYASVSLSVKSLGGHSSMPPVPQTPIGVLAEALVRLERNQMKVKLDSALLPLKFLAAETSTVLKLVSSYPNTMGWLVEHALGDTPTGNAILRTVTSPTQLFASEKENVMPNVAKANINFRIIPGDTVESVLEHVRTVVNDERVQVELSSGEDETANPSPMSPVDCWQFDVLQRSIAQTSPDALVAPIVTVAMTDGRHYHTISDHVYRFVPFHATSEDLKRIHGVNERIAKKDWQQVVKFMFQLLRNFNDVSV